MNTTTDARIVQHELEIEIDAPRKRVWRALTEEVHSWWRKDFYVGSSQSGMTFEARVGGRLYEDWGQGGGVLWYTVFAIDPGVSLDLIGHIAVRFGGPRTSMLHLELHEEGAGSTRVSMSESIQGRVDEAAAEESNAGWELLIGQGLKPYVEG